MKIIHCADIHLGSKMESKIPAQRVEERKRELRNTFLRMVQYAKEKGVSVILLSGDVFDTERPLKKDKDFFYSVVESNPEIDFLYLKGNHDSGEAYGRSDIPNLKLFGREWSYYTYGNVVIAGLELDGSNEEIRYQSLSLNKDNLNIVMLHGQIGVGGGENTVQLKRLAEKNIDYLALGHYHSFTEGKLDGRGSFAYSGCLEGRGFDETGEKGFVLLTADDRMQSQFVPFAERTIHSVQLDVTGFDSVYAVCSHVKGGYRHSPRDMIKVELIGQAAFDTDGIEKDAEGYLASDYYCVSVKNHTMPKIDVEALKNDFSLKGEFIRTVLSEDSLTEEEKYEVIAVGLKALKNGEVDI